VSLPPVVHAFIGKLQLLLMLLLLLVAFRLYLTRSARLTQAVLSRRNSGTRTAPVTRRYVPQSSI
jgi:hypothetical protein